MRTAIGTVLNGRYEIEEKLGEGGMSEVFRATDKRLGRVVVVKTLKRELLEKPDVLERFQQEARDAASLSHPNIVQVFDAEHEGNLHFIVMELCDGGDLRKLIDEHDGKIPFPRVLAIVHSLLNALAYAHQHGIVHRDIKPANILLHGQNGVKLGDFGIARALMSDTVTQQGTLIGSAAYLSPEQAQGFRVTVTGDLYSLGVVLFELVTGRVPFYANNPIALALKHVQEAPPSPRSLRPEICTERLEAVILRALAKDPVQRFQTAQDFSEALAAATSGPQPPPFPPPPKTVGTLQPDAARQPATDALPARPGPVASAPDVDLAPKGSSWALWGLLVTALAAGLLFAYYRYFGIVTVPDVALKTQQEARALLDQKGLKMVVKEARYAKNVAPGTILDQQPMPGSQEKVGDPVAVVISKGTQEIGIPKVEGTDVKDAKNTVEGLGLKSDITQEPSMTVPVGVIVRQSPEPGSEAQFGDTVALVVSTGPPSVAVPNLAGQPADVAHRKLTELGLRWVEQNPVTNSQVPKGDVISTEPGPGSMVRYGGPVALVISLGPPQFQVPDLRNMTYGDARSQAESAHLQLNLAGSASAADDDVVVAQSPDPGTMVSIPVVAVTIRSNHLQPGDTPTLVDPNSALTVPDVIGHTEEEARTALEAKGLSAGQTQYEDSDKPPGTVIEESPPSGTEVDPGSTVTLHVSSGLPSSETP